MRLLIHILFWLSLLLVVYVYLGYPLLIWLLARIRPRPVKRAPYKGRASVVIAAHNEATVIRNKITSLLETNGDVIGEILVGVDGATDGTADEVIAIGDERIRVQEFNTRRGKPSVLNDLIPQCRNDIGVLMDARQIVAPGALAVLLENFADPEVGAVSAELVFRPREACNVSIAVGKEEHAIAKGMGLYWQYEKFIRKNESRSGSVPGATGALYAIRTCLFHPIPEGILVDDVAIPMQIIQKGYRCVFEGRALIYDYLSTSTSQEQVRKRRTLAGIIQLLGWYPTWIYPGRNPVWIRFFSHKIMRLTVPFLVVVNFVCCLLLSYYETTLLYGAGVLLALIEWGCKRAGHSSRVGVPMYMFVSLNMAVVWAVWDVLRRRSDVTWQR